MGNKPPYRHLSDQECDKLILEENEFNAQLEKLGYLAKIDEDGNIIIKGKKMGKVKH